jgi:VCPO second helical-bundle domain/Domain of unknown function (DUF6851)
MESSKNPLREETMSRRRVLQTGAGLVATMLSGEVLLQASPLGMWSGRALASTVAEGLVLQWNTTCVQAIRQMHAGPTLASRRLAIVQTCIYDAWTVYDPADQSTDPTQPTGIGNPAALAVLAFRHHDGSNQLGDLHPGPYSDYTGYQPLNDPDHINDPNHWQPLRVSDGHGGFVVQKCVTPFWGQVILFGLTSGSQFRPHPGPATYGTDDYLEQAEQILQYSADLDDLTKTIAEYWAGEPFGDSAPIQWSLFGHFVSQRDQQDLDGDVKLFFILTNTALDAIIACRDAKRAYDSERPITAIHYLFQGKQVRAWAGPFQGTQWINGENWLPYQLPTVVTPPFPEYCSAHSTVSAASAKVLKLFTGSDYFGASFTQQAGGSQIEPGQTPASNVTLSWPTFSAAAQQAGLSRRYGGIHFEQGDLDGQTLGQRVGTKVWGKALSELYPWLSTRIASAQSVWEALPACAEEGDARSPAGAIAICWASEEAMRRGCNLP